MNRIMNRDELLRRVHEIQMHTIHYIFTGLETDRSHEFNIFLEFLSLIPLSDEDQELSDSVHTAAMLISLAVDFPGAIEIEFDGVEGFLQQFVDVPKTGITPEQLSKVASLKRRDRDKSGFEQPACTICLVDYKKTERVRQLPCKHNFHDACITTWLKHNTTCPLCVATIDVPPLEEIRKQPPRKCKRTREDAFNDTNEK